MVLTVGFLFFSSHFPQTTVLAFNFEEDPQPHAVSKAEILPKPSFPVFYLIPSWLASCYPHLHYRNVVVNTAFPFSLPLFLKSFLPSLVKKSPFSSDFLPDPVVISFSCPICCRALIGRCVSSFPFSLKASALRQLGLSLVFHFPICLLSAIWPPLTCGRLFLCSLHACFQPGLDSWLLPDLTLLAG